MKNSFKVLSVILVLLLTSPCFSQSLIYESGTFKKGIYRNFQELRTNNPSIALEYEIQQFEEGHNFFKTSNLAKSYQLVIDKATSKQYGHIYGFCDGTSVYINPDKPNLRPDTPFSKLASVNVLSYFESNLCARERSGGWNCERQRRVLDFQTGQVTQLTINNFMELISDDPGLKKQFKKEKKKKQKLDDYVWLYVARKEQHK